MEITQLGWNDFFDGHFEPHADGGCIPSRVVSEHREMYRVCCAHGELSASVPGRFRHEATTRADFPTVGDWVALRVSEEGVASIEAVLPRHSIVSRRFGDEERLIAVNVDTLFLVSGLDGNFNLRRIERYVTLAWDSGAVPVVLLNKADVCKDVEERVAQVEAVAIGVSVLSLSAEEGEGLDQLEPYLESGSTVALIGSSGVGKSTIINCLMGGDQMATASVREDDSLGRHTTSHRQLFTLPGGALIMDTPGMRELGLWGDDEEGFRETFDDVEALAGKCRFQDCGHQSEPGCAVQAAVESGELDAGRLRNYFKLERELAGNTRRAQRKERRAHGPDKKKLLRRNRRDDRRSIVEEEED